MPAGTKIDYILTARDAAARTLTDDYRAQISANLSNSASSAASALVGAGGKATSAAVAVNLVSVRPDGRGHLQALPTLQAPVGEFSNLNIDAPEQVRANIAIVPVGHNGSISIRASPMACRRSGSATRWSSTSRAVRCAVIL